MAAHLCTCRGEVCPTLRGTPGEEGREGRGGARLSGRKPPRVRGDGPRVAAGVASLS